MAVIKALKGFRWKGGNLYNSILRKKKYFMCTHKTHIYIKELKKKPPFHLNPLKPFIYGYFGKVEVGWKLGGNMVENP
jgi:hypothetical protein